jgi:hypothetical protein
MRSWQLVKKKLAVGLVISDESSWQLEVGCLMQEGGLNTKRHRDLETKRRREEETKRRSDLDKERIKLLADI